MSHRPSPTKTIDLALDDSADLTVALTQDGGAGDSFHGVLTDVTDLQINTIRSGENSTINLPVEGSQGTSIAIEQLTGSTGNVISAEVANDQYSSLSLQQAGSNNIIDLALTNTGNTTASEGLSIQIIQDASDSNTNLNIANATDRQVAIDQSGSTFSSVVVQAEAADIGSHLLIIQRDAGQNTIVQLSDTTQTTTTITQEYPQLTGAAGDVTDGKRNTTLLQIDNGALTTNLFTQTGGTGNRLTANYTNDNESDLAIIQNGDNNFWESEIVDSMINVDASQSGSNNSATLGISGAANVTAEIIQTQSSSVAEIIAGAGSDGLVAIIDQSGCSNCSTVLSYP